MPSGFESKPPGRKVIVMGWGANSVRYLVNVFLTVKTECLQEAAARDLNSWNRIQQKLQISTISNDECKEKLLQVEEDLAAKILSNNICAGGAGGQDACQGDSGGPLVDAHDKVYIYITRPKSCTRCPRFRVWRKKLSPQVTTDSDTVFREESIGEGFKIVTVAVFEKILLFEKKIGSSLTAIFKLMRVVTKILSKIKIVDLL